MVFIRHLEGVEIMTLFVLSRLPGVLLANSTVEGEFELRKEADCECGQFTHRKGQEGTVPNMKAQQSC